MIRFALLAAKRIIDVALDHPYVVSGGAYLGASFVFAFASETRRLRRIMRDVEIDIAYRADEIEARMTRARDEEMSATVSITDAEIAERIAP